MWFPAISRASCLPHNADERDKEGAKPICCEEQKVVSVRANLLRRRMSVQEKSRYNANIWFVRISMMFVGVH